MLESLPDGFVGPPQGFQPRPSRALADAVASADPGGEVALARQKRLLDRRAVGLPRRAADEFRERELLKFDARRQLGNLAQQQDLAGASDEDNADQFAASGDRLAAREQRDSREFRSTFRETFRDNQLRRDAEQAAAGKTRRDRREETNRRLRALGASATAFPTKGAGAEAAAGGAGVLAGVLGQKAMERSIRRPDPLQSALDDIRRRAEGGDDFGRRDRQEQELRRPRFAEGGLIPGNSTVDDTNITAMGGEFVMNRSAVARAGARNLERFNRYAEGGVVGGSSSAGGVGSGGGFGGDPRLTEAIAGFSASAARLGQSFEAFSAPAAALASGFNVFGSNIDKLVSSFEKIPTSIEHTGRFDVSVTHNGGEMFATLHEAMGKLIDSKVTAAISGAFASRLPDAPKPSSADTLSTR